MLLALFTTLPLGLLWAYPAAAAVAVSAACVLSLSAFHALTVAGLIAELAALYRLGRSGSQLLAAGLALPFLVLALAGPAGLEARTLTVLLAALGPAAAWAGAARRARSEAAEHSAAREVIAGTLVEHTARGERARVSRELHDVVAHHISMIAVQAETARLTTAGMPAAGAQRLSAIGDTARAALTEMRRLLGVLREDTRGTAGSQTGSPSRACSSSTSCSTRHGTPRGRASASSSAGAWPLSTPASSSPPTASCRRRSPMPGGTPRAPPWTWSCITPRGPCGYASVTTGPAPRPPPPAHATAVRWPRAARHARARRCCRR